MLGQGNSTFLFCRYCDTLYSPFHIFVSDTLLLPFLFLLLLFSLLFLPSPISTPQRNLLIRLSPSFLPVSQTLSCHKPLTYDYFSSPADLRMTKHRYAKLHCEVACIISTLNVLIVLHPLCETAITILFFAMPYGNVATSYLCALLHDWWFVLSLAFLVLTISYAESSLSITNLFHLLLQGSLIHLQAFFLSFLLGSP